MQLNSNELSRQLESEPEYSILNDPEQRSEIARRTLDLVELIKAQEYDTVVWLDRAARPFSWFTEAVWARQYPNLPLPEFIYLNIGREKNLRQRYMLDSGITDNYGTFHHQFTGIFEPEEKVAVFEQRVRDDKDIQRQLEDEIGYQGYERLAGKKVLIADHMEFEGVSRLFTEFVLEEIYSPTSIDYFEFGGWINSMPTGLEDDGDGSSFLAKESDDPQEQQTIRILNMELARLALSTQLEVENE